MVEYTVWTASQRKLPTINEIVPCLGQYIARIHDWIEWALKRAGSRNSSSSSRKSRAPQGHIGSDPWLLEPHLHHVLENVLDNAVENVVSAVENALENVVECVLETVL